MSGMNMLILIAAAIVAQPLVDADVLEPSVLNEVDHALSRAPTNEVALSAESVAFATLWATNGASATDRAIALVSSQRSDGRWLHGGKDVTPAAVLLLCRAAGYPEPPFKLSVCSNLVGRADATNALERAASSARYLRGE
jgi:hypothetical protein